MMSEKPITHIDKQRELAKMLYETQWTIPPNEFNELDDYVIDQWLATANFVRKLLLEREIRIPSFIHLDSSKYGAEGQSMLNDIVSALKAQGVKIYSEI